MHMCRQTIIFGLDNALASIIKTNVYFFHEQSFIHEYPINNVHEHLIKTRFYFACVHPKKRMSLTSLAIYGI